jgi:DNA-directed RNA polymerase specialized sigma24 family protein
MKLNSYKERKACWEMLQEKYSTTDMKKAFNTLKPDCAKVLRLHYDEHYPLSEITSIINRSITVVRNHHNRGIYKLYRYFNPRTFENV